MIAIVVALLLLALPNEAYAFGPSTHFFLGRELLQSLSLLPPALATLLRAHPMSFLYGSIAADISFAKKYVPAGRHCHYWPVGKEILDAAENERSRATALGYLAHLAADTIAHNTFIPRQLLLTSSTKALGHSYWEARLDRALGYRCAAQAREVVMNFDHSEADALFDRVLSGTLFTFETNRRIFRGMIRFQDNERWQSVFERMLRKSRWNLPEGDAKRYLTVAFDFMVDYMLRGNGSEAAKLDATGAASLKLAKRARRIALRRGARWNKDVLRDLADRLFPIPETNPSFWANRRSVSHMPR